MFTITFRFETGNPVVIDANPGEKLLDVARKANVAIDAPCSGNGVCGKCRVRLASGSLDAPINRHITQEEYDLAMESQEAILPVLYQGPPAEITIFTGEGKFLKK